MQCEEDRRRFIAQVQHVQPQRLVRLEFAEELAHAGLHQRLAEHAGLAAAAARARLAQAFTALMVTHDVGEAVALADRMLVLADGRVTLALHVNLPRPRARGTPASAALEGRLLEVLLADDRSRKADAGGSEPAS